MANVSMSDTIINKSEEVSKHCKVRGCDGRQDLAGYSSETLLITVPQEAYISSSKRERERE
jgi:hypothetical protein